jgi:nucleotide-binding universal stress UspA family protein
MTDYDDGKILLATDFSQPAQRAYAYAAKLATALSTRMVILNVLEGPPGLDREFPVNTLYLKQLQEEADRELTRLVRLAKKAGVSVEPWLEYGNTAHCISQAAEKTAAALIVLGTHGRTGWNRALLGSTAEAVVREAPCPVLTVRMTEEPIGPPDTVAIECLLVPIDFSECAQEALEYAARLAKQLNARLRLVHAMTSAAYPLDFALFGVSEEMALREKVHAHLDELVSVVKADGIAAESVSEIGAPADVILKHAKEEGAGAIVMGTHGRRGLSHLALGSVAEYVVRHAACPVFTVKSPRYRYKRTSEVHDAKQKV